MPIDDSCKFTELYNVQRLKSSFMAKDSDYAQAALVGTMQRRSQGG